MMAQKTNRLTICCIHKNKKRMTRQSKARDCHSDRICAGFMEQLSRVLPDKITRFAALHKCSN